MSAVYHVEPLSRAPDATVRVPGSKSLTNRALLIAALAEGPSTLSRRCRKPSVRQRSGSVSGMAHKFGWSGRKAK